ncbi:MAG: adenylosuccinate lyase [Planctomycetaceae bacterium]
MTTDPYQRYENPLTTRYASPEMGGIWSAQTKHSTWRRLWVALAEAQRELGLDISAAQIAELREAVDDIDFQVAARYERERRHDVMAHNLAFGDRCPTARGVIHLGATSCFVTDNTELIQIRDSLRLTLRRLVSVIDRLATFAEEHRDLACLGLTHLQTAQPTTVGKRAAVWCYDLVLDLEALEHRIGALKFRGVKGTTGTQASFLSLFDGDREKVRRLDRLLAEKMGFAASYPVTGQTYPRKIDAQVLEALGGVAQSAHKAGSDIRILQHGKELEEPFEEKQIGSSAMAYKRNPMRSERMCALARFAMSLANNAAQTAAVQWMERTLDDSANRRLSLPQAFLAVDAVLILYRNIADGLVVYPRTIEKHLREELPFIATEEILMAGVQVGVDRQELHERIRVHSRAAAERIQRDGSENDLLNRLRNDELLTGVDFDAILDVQRFVGRAPQQVDEFLAEVVAPIRKRYRDDLGGTAEELHV